MNELLDPRVQQALDANSLEYRVLACDPALADTAAFCEHYGFALEQSANTILITSRKVEPAKYAFCVVLADSRVDVNKKVCELMGIKRASFADGETTTQLTGMMIGGVTPIGINNLASDLPIYVDSRVMQQTEVVMGGGNRSSKLALHPQELLKLPNVQVVVGLSQLKNR